MPIPTHIFIYTQIYENIAIYTHIYPYITNLKTKKKQAKELELQWAAVKGSKNVTYIHTDIFTKRERD